MTEQETTDIRTSIGILYFSEVPYLELPALEICINFSAYYERRFSCGIMALGNALLVLGSITKEEYPEKLIDFSLRLNDSEPDKKGICGKEIFNFIGQAPEFVPYDRALHKAYEVPVEYLLGCLSLGAVLLVVEKWQVASDELHLNLIFQEQGKVFGSGKNEMNYEDLCRRVYCSPENYVIVIFSHAAKAALDQYKSENAGS